MDCKRDNIMKYSLILLTVLLLAGCAAPTPPPDTDSYRRSNHGDYARP
jgi:uncharacterized lipoprotein YajG